MTLISCDQSTGWSINPAYSRNRKPPALAGGRSRLGAGGRLPDIKLACPEHNPDYLRLRLQSEQAHC